MIDENFRDMNSEEVWVAEDTLNGWMKIEIAYYKLRNHWLVKLAIKLRIIKL